MNHLEEQLSKLYYEVRSIYFSCKYAGSDVCKGCNRYELCHEIVVAAYHILLAAKLANYIERKETK